MPRWRKPTREEIRERRMALLERARSGRLILPDAIAEMRHALGLSQLAFANLFRLTKRQLAEIERGEANPTAATLNRIARLFGFGLGFVPRMGQDHSSTQEVASSLSPSEEEEEPSAPSPH